jgi:hypothetical protein
MTQTRTRTRPYRELARTNEAVYRSVTGSLLAVWDRTVAKRGNASYWLTFRPYLESGETYANGWCSRSTCSGARATSRPSFSSSCRRDR